MTNLELCAAVAVAGIIAGVLIGTAAVWALRRMYWRRIRRAWEQSHPGLDWDEWMAR